MSRLPAGYQWAAAIPDVARLVDDGIVPVLRPAEPERAERWAAILRTYPAPALHQAAPPGARVASLAGHEDLGEPVARALGRPHHVFHPGRLNDPSALGRRGGSVLVVARARSLTLDVLMPLLIALAAQNTLAGFLTGRDDAACTFAAAKLLTWGLVESGPARTAILDGTTGLAHVLTAGLPDRRSTMADVLAAPWNSLLVDADGSAAHAHLGHVTLCGLTGTAEHALDGTPLTGGCTFSLCKADPTGRVRPLPPHDLRTRVLGLFVCNAITLGESEQFPSDVNLALDAVEGHPQAVLGLLRGDLSTSGREPRIMAAGLHSGTRLGHCATLLDADGRRRGIRGPSVLLLGDPEQQLHTPDAPPVAFPSFPSSVPERALGDGEALKEWRVRLADAEAFEHGLRISLHRRPDTGLSGCLDEMVGHRRAALDLLLAAVHGADDRWADGIEERSVNWGHAVLEILSRTRGGAFARQLAASRLHHRTSHWSAAPSCGYCGAPREYEHLTSAISLTSRTSLRCPRCGPALSLPPTLRPLSIEAPPALRPGQLADIRVTIPTPATGLLAVHLRPRSTRRGSYDHAVLSAAPGRRTVALAVPERTLPELDRLWVMHADRFHLAYYQHRLPLLPTQQQ